MKQCYGITNSLGLRLDYQKIMIQIPSGVLRSVILLKWSLIKFAMPRGILNPVSAKYSAGSNNVVSGNLANFSAASDTAAIKPGTRTDAPLSPGVWTSGMSDVFA